MTPERKNNLLGYIDQLKALSGAPVDEEDLYAAGFDEEDLESIGWFDQQQAYTPTEEPTAQLDPYTPTKREQLHDKSTRGLESLGVPKSISQDIADTFVGSEFGPIAGMGVIDLTPFGLPLGVQEGSNAMERGYNSGDAIGMGLGAVEAVGAALPMGKAVSKFGKKIIDKGVEAYNPNVARTFFGPNSKLADHDKLKTAQIMEQEGQTPEDIWQKTGWWDTPNGWRFEVSDNNLEINPEALEHYQKDGVRTRLDRGLDHQEFWDAISGSGKKEERQNHSLELLPTRMSPSGYYDSLGKKVSVTARNEEELKDILVHELQHYEQKAFEKPSQGANYSYVKDQIASTVDNLPREALEYLATTSYYSKQIRASEEAIAVAEAHNKKPKPSFEEDPLGHLDVYDMDVLYREKEDLIKRAQADLQGMIKEVGPEFAEKLDDLWLLSGGYSGAVKKVDDFNFEVSPQQAAEEWLTGGHKAYERNWGETEARLSASRRTWSDEDRRQYFPGHGEEVLKYEDQGFWGTKEEFVDTLRLVNNYAEDFRAPNSKRGYAKGGSVEVDPLSGNEVPPGAEPVEVRDDIDAKLSEGEYVIPADVVRYLGLDKIEKLVAQAKEGLAEMDKNGRIGGEDVVEEDDLPFSDEELFGGEAPIEMAVGGLIPAAGDRIRSQVGVTPNTTMPLWMQDQNFGGFQEEQNVAKDGSRQQPQQVSKWDKDVSQWSPEQFSQAVTQRNSLGSKVIETGIGKMIPFGGLALRAKNNYINKNAPIAIDKMLKSGMDAQGNPLTDQQKVDLAKAKTDLAATAKQQPGLGGMVMKEVKGLIDRKTPEEKAKAEAEKAAKEKAEKDAKDKAAKDKADKDRASKDRPGKDKDDKGSKGKK